MALSDKEVGSIISKLMAGRKDGGQTPQSGTPVSPEPAGNQAAPEEGSNIYDDILSDVMSGDADGASGEEDEAASARIDDLYSEFASPDAEPEELFPDDLPGVSVEPEGAGYPEEVTADAADENEEAAGADDDVLMAALGYSDNQVKEKPAAKAEPAKTAPVSSRVNKADMVGAFAWRGHEYKSKSQRGDILREYDCEQRLMYVRIGGTGLFFLLALLFELLGNRFGGAFSKADYPVVHIMTSLQLLLLCAAFSARRLLSGLVDIMRGSPSGASVSAVSVALTILYDLILSLAVSVSDVDSFALYSIPAALSLCALVASDQYRLSVETKTFSKLSTFDTVCTLERVDDEKGCGYRLHRGNFVRDYFRRTNRRSETLKTANYIILPIIAAALILSIISLASKGSFIGSTSVFIAVVHAVLPVFAIVAFDLPFRVLANGRTDSYSVILNEQDTAEFAHVRRIILDETDIFNEESLKIVKVSQCAANADIFEIMSVTGAVCSKVGGTISRAFSSISETGDFATNAKIEIIDVDEGGIDASVDGKIYTLGTVKFLGDRGIACRGCNDAEYAASTRGGTVFHIAVDGREVFRYYMQYIPDPTFIELVGTMADRGIGIEIICKDPNLSSAFITSMIGDENVNPEIVRQNGAAPESGDSGVIDGGLIADGSEWMSVIRLADSCQVYRSVSRINNIMILVLIGICALTAATLAIAGSLTGLSSAVFMIAQAIAVLPSIIISRLQLSRQ